MPSTKNKSEAAEFKEFSQMNVVAVTMIQWRKLTSKSRTPLFKTIPVILEAIAVASV